MPRKYLASMIIDMAENVPRSQLTSYQRSLVNKYEKEKITPEELADYTGIDKSEIWDRIHGSFHKDWKVPRQTHGYDGYGIDPNSIRYIKGYGFVARTNNNPKTGKSKMVQFYIVVGPDGQHGYFGDDEEVAHIEWKLSQDKQQQGCRTIGTPYYMYIPQKEKERKPKHTKHDIFSLKGQVTPESVAPENKSLIYWMRRHPNATLKEFNAYNKSRKR